MTRSTVPCNRGLRGRHAYDEAAATQARAYVKELLAGVFAAK